MPRINQYTDNTTIENDDKMLTYDTQGAATKLTSFSTIWSWITSKLHALTSSSAALTPSTDRVLMDKNGTMTRVEPAAVAKYGIETYNGSTIAGSAQTVKSALDALNSKETLDSSFNHTRIPANSSFNSYTTPGVYYVSSDSDAATITDIPRKSSGKLVVMARHSDSYLVQYYYPSTAVFIRYVRSYISGAWYVWIREEINYYNNQTKVYDLGELSSASNKTFEQLGLSIYQYGAYFVVLRGDSAGDASWVGIVRHNAAGYQITQIYKGAPTNTAYVDSNGIVKTDNSTGLNTVAFVQPLLTWGNVM